MGEETDQLKAQISEKRDELGRNIAYLQAKVKRTVDWRAHFRERPIALLAGAFGVGLAISAVGGSRPNGYGQGEPGKWVMVKGVLIGLIAARWLVGGRHVVASQDVMGRCEAIEELPIDD